MGTCNIWMSEESKFNNVLGSNSCFFPKFILNFFPPCDILPNLMFLYTVTTLKDAIKWLFEQGLWVAERKWPAVDHDWKPSRCLFVCLFVWNKPTRNMAVYTDVGLQDTWARAVSAHWMYHVTQFGVNGGKKRKEKRGKDKKGKDEKRKEQKRKGKGKKRKEMKRKEKKRKDKSLK